MDLEVENLSYEDLQQMPYSELRKVASKHGIQRIMKADKLISAVMSKMINNDYSFSSPAAKEMNSSKKNKEKIFDEIQKTPLATPRRGTFTVETPSFLEPADPTIAVHTSVLDMSNVTLDRGSERKLRPRKVSFMSPAMTPRTPKSQSLRNRPKTPVASRTPLSGTISSASVESLDEPLPATPAAKKLKLEINADMKVSNEEMNNSTPIPVSVNQTEKSTRSSRAKLSPAKAQGATKSIVGKTPTLKETQTPGATKSIASKEPTSMKKKQTPNFRRIHQKAFDKMESIDDYQKRKLLNSAKKVAQHSVLKSKVMKAKSRIPAFSGIPFVPSTKDSVILGSKANKLRTAVGATKSDVSKEATSLKKKQTPKKHKGPKENIPIAKRDSPLFPKLKFDSKPTVSKKETPASVKSKSRFDLKASLSRKLGYKPYRGPLKPLAAANNTALSSSFLNAKEPVPIKAISKNRSQTRSLVRGVRMNKRFELQMRNRK